LRIDVAGLSVPLVALPSPIHAFFISAWMPAGLAATANLMPPALRAQAAALMIVILTVLGAGLGPLLTGMLSDALATVSGIESLRYAILASLGTLVLSAVLFWRASITYPADLAGTAQRGQP
jgi:MFS family permease